jgi:homopolymeric O-antigen transport system permease protein
VLSTPDAPAGSFRLTAKPDPLRVLVREIWRSRELMRMLARQDFFVKYRRESFGFLWAVGLPLLQAAILAVVFTRVIRIQTGTNFATFVFAGLLPWTFFAGAISSASTSIVDGQGLATKIYFPRALLPLVTIRSALYGFFPSVAALIIMALVFSVPLGVSVVYLVPGIALLVLLTASMALVLSAMHVYFRDVRYIVSAALFGWLYATPVLYPVRLAPHSLRIVLDINPVTGVVELFRAAIGAADPGWELSVGICCVWVAVLLTVAATVHRRLDRVFVDPL